MCCLSCGRPTIFDLCINCHLNSIQVQTNVDAATQLNYVRRGVT